MLSVHYLIVLWGFPLSRPIRVYKLVSLTDRKILNCWVGFLASRWTSDMPTVGMCVCQAEKLILMTDVPGVLRDKDDVDTKYAELNIRQTQELVQEGVIAGGMIPKVQCCKRSISQGVAATHIIDGRQQHSLLLELLTEAGVGTMITG